MTEELARARAAVVEWDEYLQGYDTNGKLVICVCGKPFPDKDHVCPYDERENRDA